VLAPYQPGRERQQVSYHHVECGSLVDINSIHVSQGTDEERRHVNVTSRCSQHQWRSVSQTTQYITYSSHSTAHIIPKYTHTCTVITYVQPASVAFCIPGHTKHHIFKSQHCLHYTCGFKNRTSCNIQITKQLLHPLNGLLSRTKQ